MGRGGGHDPLVHLSYSSNSGAAKICQRGAKRGSEATERGEGVGRGFPPSHGREIFQNLWMKLAFSCTLDTIIRGSLCTGIDQFPTLFLFSFFSYMNLFQETFSFSLSFSPFFRLLNLRGRPPPSPPPPPWLRHCPGINMKQIGYGTPTN